MRIVLDANVLLSSTLCDDNKIIDCALASSSNYVVTYGKHLLNLKNFREIRIITPEEAFGLLEF